MTKRGQPDSLALFQRATGRQGVFTLEDARQSGYSQPLVHHYVQAGRFQRIGAGIYRLTEYPRGENDRFAELSALLGPGAILSHESALALYPVSDVAPSKYHFTIPRSKRYARPPADDVVIHTVTNPVDPLDIVNRHGFKATSLARSIVDSARAGTAPEQIQAAISAGLTRGLLRETDFKRVLTTQPARVRTLVENTVRAWSERPA
uniref:AbiEi antitoxin N-terminal domain-containing protein n=1 Tax=mine drainage metagenome TaxID=410659 RepID=E6Q3D7_9ZZZZ